MYDKIRYPVFLFRLYLPHQIEKAKRKIPHKTLNKGMPFFLFRFNMDDNVIKRKASKI